MKYIWKILSTEAFKDYFTITDENDELDWEQVIISVIQTILVCTILAVVGYFFF